MHSLSLANLLAVTLLLPLGMGGMGVASAQTLTTLHSFSTSTNGTNWDGAYPNAVTLSSDGRTLYGTTYFGGTSDYGTVFSIPVTGGAPTVLASFNDPNDPDNPIGGMPNAVTLSSDGKTLYGTTSSGGTGFGGGTVFSIPVTGGALAVLATFNFSDGAYPLAPLTLSSDGNTLYGTTTQGGTNGTNNGGNGYGTIFSIPVTGGVPTVLASFNFNDPYAPQAPLTLSADGNTLYGTTEYGGIYGTNDETVANLSLIHISEPTRPY